MAKKETVKADEQSFFDRPEMEAYLFWPQFAGHMKHIQAHTDCILKNKRKHQIIVDRLGQINAEIDAIKALMIKTYGLVLDTDPSHTECVEDVNHDHLIDLYFWSMDYQKEIEFIINNSSDIAFKLEDELNDKGPQQQIELIFNSMHAIFSLIANAIKIPVMLLNELDFYLRIFRESERGEGMVSGWRKDYLLSREQLLLRLKEIKSYRPWVDKCRLLHEGKIEKRELFIDKTIPGVQHNVDMKRTNSWFSIFAILTILIEYDERQEIVRKMKPYFKFNEDVVRRFLIEIQGLEAQQITALVKKFKDDETATEEIKSKNFWRILVDYELYDKGYPNWNNQVI